MIIIGADIVPTASNIQYFENGEVNELIDDRLHNLLNDADYRILNLEVPLTDKQDPILKCGPNLIASTRSVEAIKNMKIDLLTLANNHIMDQGVQGLSSTIGTLERACISYVGAGKNLEDAAKPFFFTIKGKKYGVYACAEHEFSIADEENPGANPFDPLESLEHVEQIKSECDYTIVLYHGGKEHYRYPSPNLQKICRKLVEKGADLVVCQHSHCIGCKEEYLNGTIVYGQGNFLFDGQDNEYWNSSILLQIEDDRTISYIPVIKIRHGVCLADIKTAEGILNNFNSRSAEIMQNNCITDRYDEFAKAYIDDYILMFSGKEKSFMFRAMNKLLGHRLRGKFSKMYRNKYGVEIKNFIECEAHRELILQGLEDEKKSRAELLHKS